MEPKGNWSKIKYDSFLNALEETFRDHYSSDDKMNEVLLKFSQELIDHFVEMYGEEKDPMLQVETRQLVIEYFMHQKLNTTMTILITTALGTFLILNFFILYRLIGLRINRDKIDRSLREEFARNREESTREARDNREEVMGQMTKMSVVQTEQFESTTRTSGEKMDQLIKTIESKLNQLQQENIKKLEHIRETVDEKLHHTLERRLGESFELVSKRLEDVHKGLGEMQNLANGVGDLKKVLTNVKTRGIIGEYQLENLLDQLLTPEQYAKNVKTKKNSSTFVEFAIKLPGDLEPVWLPVDSKFPLDDYQKLLEAYDQSDLGVVESLTKQLISGIKGFAKDISEKYLDPPNTTDFGIMFLPIEGLYAEVLRNPGLFELVQREYRVIITGPTTISALLNSLQMGFRTLAVEKRSSEVWKLLGAVKTEFSKFGGILEKVQKKLKEASNEIGKADSKTRTIERKLRDVEQLPLSESDLLIQDNKNPKIVQELPSVN